jgi:hypothetical protein
MPLIEFYLSRKAKMLSVLFFVTVLSLASCKKQKTSVGKSGLNQNQILNSFLIDTFSLKTYTESEDTLYTSNPLYNLIGCYNDPIFGKVNANFYTQFRLAGVNPNFGTDIKIDSFVMAFEYAAAYGTLETQTFLVQQLSEDINVDSSYYKFTNKNVFLGNLIQPGYENIKPNPYGITVVGNDTVTPQLRIKIDTNLARQFVNDASTVNFSSNESFLSYFKGVKVSVIDTISKPSGKGAVFYLNSRSTNSKLTIYYTQAGLQKTFDFVINSSCADFNHTNYVNSTAVQNVISSQNGQNAYYAQAGKSRARIEFPSLTNLPENALIQKAELVLPISYYSTSPYFPSFSVSVATRLTEPFGALLSLGIEPTYDATRKAYVLDLRDYVQRVVNRQITNNGLYLAPKFFNTTIDRIVLNGQTTSYKNKPKLSIVYTKF